MMSVALRLCCSCCAILSCMLAQAADTAKDFDRQLHDAEQHLGRRNYLEAHRLAKATGDESPENRHRLAALQLLAHIYARSGRPSDALRCAQRFLELVEGPQFRNLERMDADRQEMAVLVAEASAEMGYDAQAHKWFDYALRIPRGLRIAKPSWQAATQLSWANATRKIGEHERADKLYQDAADSAQRELGRIERKQVPGRMRPSVTDVYVDTCLALGRHGDAERALATLADTELDEHDRFHALVRLAEVLGQSAQTQREIELLEKALRERPDDVSRSTEEQTERTTERAVLLERLAAARKRQAPNDHEPAAENLRQSAAYLAKLCTARGNDPAATPSADNLQRWHDIAVELGAWDQALVAATQLLSVRQQTLLANDPAIYRAHRSLGICYAKRNQPSQCAKHLDEALAFWERYEPRQTKELRDTRQNRAETARAMGDYDTAEKHFRRLLQDILDDPRADPIALIECRVSLGNVLSARAEYDTARAEYHQAVAACEKLNGQHGDKLRQLHGLALLGRATINKTQLDFDKAIDDCVMALALYGEPESSQSGEQVPVLVTLASLRLAKYAWDAGPPNSPDLQSARDYIARANRLSRDGAALEADPRCQLLHVSALTSFREAQAQFRQDGSDDRQAAAAACAKAIEHWQQAQSIAAENHLPATLARTACALAEAQLLACQIPRDAANDASASTLEAARKNASQAIALLDDLQAFPALHYRALLVRAKIVRLQAELTRGQGNVDDATMEQIVHDLRDATTIVEAPRANSLGTQRDRAEFFSQFVEAYELLVSYLAEMGQYDDAVAYSQISRNRTFLEEVEISEDDLRASLQKVGKLDLLEKLQDEIVNSEELRRKLQDNANRGQPVDENQTERAKWIEALRISQIKCDKLASEIRQSTDRYQNLLKGGLTLEDWQHARDRVVGSNGLMLIYHLGPTASELFVVTPGHVDCHRLELSEEAAGQLSQRKGPLTSVAVRDLVNRYLMRSALQPGNTTRVTQTGDAPRADARGRPTRTVAVAAALTDDQALLFTEAILPKRVLDEIRDREPLVLTVAPDGALHQLPLEALLLSSKPEKYVLDDVKIPPMAYAPSAMVMAALQTDERTVVAWPPEVLTVGDPKYTTLSPLASAGKECARWKTLFGRGDGNNVDMLVQDEATEGRVREHVSGKRFVHFAVHGLVDRSDDSGFAASLALTPGKDVLPANAESLPKLERKLLPDDGSLYLPEVYALPLKGCEMAVLSACESNIGKPRKLEAGSTLTRAFLSAGSRRVVSSLWMVDDVATADMMDAFASSVAAALEKRQSLNYAEALQQARRHIRQSKEHEEWHDPYYWAPFVLIGPPK